MRISDWRSDVALPIECDAPGLPVRLCLLDPLPARRDEVPPDEALAERLAAEQHDGRGLFSGDRRRRIAPEDEHLARRVAVPLPCDAPLGNVGRALPMALRQVDTRFRLQPAIGINPRPERPDRKYAG